MIVTEKGIRRAIRKAVGLHSAFMIYRRFGLDYHAYAAKRDRDEVLAVAREAKQRISKRCAQ